MGVGALPSFYPGFKRVSLWRNARRNKISNEKPGKRDLLSGVERRRLRMNEERYQEFALSFFFSWRILTRDRWESCFCCFVVFAEEEVINRVH